MLDESNIPDNNDLNNDLNSESPEAAPPPEESNNRTFLIIGGIIAAVILVTLICGAGYVFILGPRLTAQRSAAAKATAAANALFIQQETSTAEAALWTPTAPPTATSTKTAIPVIPTNTVTPVVAVNTPTPTTTVLTDAATLAYLQTQLAVQMTATALAKGTGTPGKPLPTTGFFDQVGLPSLVVLTLALVLVIFLARRLRGAPAK